MSTAVLLGLSSSTNSVFTSEASWMSASLMNTLPPPLDAVMVKTPSLVSVTEELDVSVTRTCATVLALFGTVHGKLPREAAVLEMRVLQVVPSSVYSSFTLVTPVDIQTML